MDCPQHEETTMLAKMLHDLNSDGRLTVGEIADVWKIEAHSVYPYLNGRWPTVDKLIDLVRYCVDHGKPAVAVDIINLITRGCRITSHHLNLAGCDFNGDGVVDEADLLKQTRGHVGDFAAFVDAMIGCVDDGQIDEVERDLADAQIDQLHVSLETTRQIIREAAARNARRRINSNRRLRSVPDCSLFGERLADQANARANAVRPRRATGGNGRAKR